MPKRGHYDRTTVHAIIDEALVCHVAFAVDGAPAVIPTLHARRGESLLLHGARTSRLLKHIADGNPVSVAMTILDGIVFARSVFHHSMNYRSVVVLGRAQLLEDPAEKIEALEVIVEHVNPGRWANVRWPNEKELKATSVLSLSIAEASAKIRTGPPIDDEEDMAVPCWAGVLPLQVTTAAPVPDERCLPGFEAPAFTRPRRARS